MMFQLVVHEFLQEIVNVEQSLHLQCGEKDCSASDKPNDLQNRTKRGTHFHVWNEALFDFVAVVRDWLDVGTLFTERASHRSCCIQYNVVQPHASSVLKRFGSAPFQTVT